MKNLKWRMQGGLKRQKAEEGSENSSTRMGLRQFRNKRPHTVLDNPPPPNLGRARCPSAPLTLNSQLKTLN
jgi:hypothetical protein